MSQLSVHITEDSIGFSRDGQPAAILPRLAVDAEGLALFQKQNYDLQGTVGYPSFLEGVYAGLSVAFGPPSLALVELASEAGQSDLELYADVMKDRLAPGGDLSSEPAKELQTVEAGDVGTVDDVLLAPVFSEEIIVPGITVHDGVIVGTGERTREEVTTSEIPAETAAEVPAATEAPKQP